MKILKIVGGLHIGIITQLASLLLLFFSCSRSIDESRSCVVFPTMGEPVQLTKDPFDHFYASYYGIDSWNASQKYATVLQTTVKNRLPTEEDEATLGLVDMDNHEFIPLTTTRAWNFQEGCMAHWLGTSPDSLVIFNDIREGKAVSVIINAYTKQEIRSFSYPVSAVSPDGKHAVSINFSRLRITRTDYGYGGEGQDPRADDIFPADDGLFLLDLETGEAKLLVSLADVRALVPTITEEKALEYFCHTRFSRDGSKIFWLARSIPKWNTTSLTVNIDGTDLQRCFPDGWGGSHYDWLSDDQLMVTATFEGKQYAHILFDIGSTDYKRLGNGLLDYDGHGTFSPDGRWMITDSYPSGGLREQKLYLMDMETEAVLPLGRFKHAEEYEENNRWARCDLHCRWSSKGNLIGFNSTHSGSRQVYVLKLDGFSDGTK